MAVQACVLTFNVRSGTGTQTVTGVVDQNGNPFVGKFFFILGGQVAVDTLTAGGSANVNSYIWDMGVDNGTYAGASAQGDNVFQFPPTKIASGGVGNGGAFLDFQSDIFFGGTQQRNGYVSAIRSGEFDITFTLNNRTGDAYMVAVLGGDVDVNLYPTGVASQTTMRGGTTYPTVSTPKGLWTLQVQAPQAARNSPTTGAGGGASGFGFQTVDGSKGYISGIVGNFSQSGGANSRYQSTAEASADIGLTVGSDTNKLSVATWGSSDFTTDVTTATGNGRIPVAFSGASVRCASGAFTQVTATGTQTIDTGINPRLLLFLTVGAPANAAVQVGTSMLTVGMGTPTQQHCFWTAESATGSPLTGARYLASNAVLKFGDPAGASSTLANVATLSSVTTDGTVTLTWSSVSGAANQILWFALGEDPPRGTLELTKVWNGIADQTTLQIGTTPHGTDIASAETGAAGGPPLTTGVYTLPNGTYYVSETNSSSFAVTRSGTRNGVPFTVPQIGTVDVSSGDEIIVTFTNSAIRPSQWQLERFDIKVRPEQRA